MLTIILGYILLGLIPVLCFFRKYKALVIISLLSQYTEAFAIVLGGFKFTADVYIGLIFVIANFGLFTREKTKIGIFLWIEYFWVIGIGFLFLLSPWKDSAAQYRTWTQSQMGRTLIGIVRMVEPILVFYFYYYVFLFQKITLRFFLFVICWLAIGSVFISILDTYILEGFIKSQFHFLERDVLIDRFTALFVEPRYLARILGITTIILLCLKDTISDNKAQKLYNLTILSCILGISLTMSSSGIGATFIAFLVYLLLFSVSLKRIIFYTSFLIFGLVLVLQNERFVTHTLGRLAILAVEEEDREIPNVPTFISSLEANDACALAFFYHHPKHLIWGVGPNTICIPANDYMAPYTEKALNFSLNNPPYLFLLYYVSRSGMVGVLCYCLAFGVLAFSFWKINRVYSKFIIVCFTFFFISCNNFNIIFAILGLTTAAYQQVQKGLNKHISTQWT